MKRKTKQQRREEAVEMMRNEIKFQFSRFRYSDSLFYKEGLSTKTWFSVEASAEKADLTRVSDIMVKRLSEFITAGMSFSLKEELELSEAAPIIRQSLHVPITLDVMMQIILAQEKFSNSGKYGWGKTFFLGSKLTVVKLKGWGQIDPLVRLSLGDVCYPAMEFKPYGDDCGLWLPSIVRATEKRHDFRTAVYIKTSS